VREKRAKEQREKQTAEEAKKLDAHASEIARVLNEDFANVGRSIPKVETDASGKHDLRGTEVEIRAPCVSDEGQRTMANEAEFPPSPSPDPESIPQGDSEQSNSEGSPDARDAAGAKTERPPDATTHGNAAKPSGGFAVKYDHMGKDTDRSKYLREDRCILINLDHPQLDTARGGGTVESPAFRRLAVEVAFSQYAMAIVFELVQQEGTFHELTEPIDAICETLNRIARAGAHLYAG
jgi:hypothetical protein